MKENEEDLELIAVGGRLIERSTLERARKVAIAAAAIRAQVTPQRILAATLVLLMLTISFFALIYYAVPYDKTEVKVIFVQTAAGHVVLAELQNDGSREIKDINVELRFTKSIGNEELNVTNIELKTLPGHRSAAGDDLELLIQGVSGWEEYIVTTTVTYTDNKGNIQEIASIREVGEWQTESWTVSQGLRLLL